MKCSKCGAELSENTRFCSYCGQKAEVTPPSAVEDPEIPSIPYVEKAQEDNARKAGKTKSAAPKSLADKGKDKGIEIWNKLSLYGKVTTVSIAVFVLLCLIALLAGKTAAVVISIVQVVMAVVSILMHKSVIKLEQKKTWLKWLILMVAILLTALYVTSYSWGNKTSPSRQNPEPTDQTSENVAEEIDWENITLHKALPKPQSNRMELLFNGDDWLSVTVYDISENDFLEYVRWCKDDFNFTVDSDSFDGYFYAYNQEGYCLTLLYTKTSREFSINLDAPVGKTEDSAPTTEYISQTQKNGFNPLTNEVYTLAGYTVEIPKYWKSESKIDGGFQRYAETGGKVAMLQISAQAESDDNYPVTFDGLMDDNDNMIAAIESTVFKEVTDYEVVDTGAVKGILYKGTIIDKESGLSGYGEWFAFASEEDRTWCTLIFCQTDNSEYSYTDDFMKMIKSIKPVENTPPETTITPPTTNEITLTMGKDDFKGMNYQEAEQKFREMGFTAFKYETVDTKTESTADTICYIEITEWLFGKSDFERGDKFDADATVTFYTYKYTAPSPVSYSTNDLETAKKGNSGVFSYKSRGGSYDIYWIIDFDEGYVYWFTDGNGDSTCDRVAIVSGTLNDAVTITYHDGDSTWSNRLFFKWQNQPDHLVMQDHNGFTYDYYSTNLSSALRLRNARTIYDY